VIAPKRSAVAEGKQPEKRPRTSRGKKAQVSPEEVQRASSEIDETPAHKAARKDAGESSAGARTRQLVLGAMKDTRRKSDARALNPTKAPARPEMCRRCAGELKHFPKLTCWTSPNSPLGKCGDCVKKGKSCQPVSSLFSRRRVTY
jgi:hypothetical protein